MTAADGKKACLGTNQARKEIKPVAFSAWLKASVTQEGLGLAYLDLVAMPNLFCFEGNVRLVFGITFSGQGTQFFNIP